MSINLGSNIRVQTTLPLDAKYAPYADNTARDAILAGERYQGMIVFVTATSLTWQLQGGITNANWTAFGAGGSSTDQSYETSNLTLTATVAANALTVSLKTKAGADPSAGDPVKIGFRNVTLTTGTYAQVSSTAATSLVVSSGSTLGTVSAAGEYINIYAINNAGTIELAIGVNPTVDEGTVVSTTAEGGAGAADTRTVLYSTTARTNIAVRLIGRIKSTQATAGTWATAISEISLLPFLNYGERSVGSTTVQKFTSGSGTYTKPAAVSYLKITMVGGGGGGGGGALSTDGATGTGGGAGGNTTFGSNTAAGGTGGTKGYSAGAGGAGGAATLSGSSGIGVTGATGNASCSGKVSNEAYIMPAGGSSALGGAGAGGGSTGAGITNTGGGGAGGITYFNGVDVSYTGGAGGAGAYISAIILTPSATYSYAVGAAGTAGTGGSNGGAGGAGGSGLIVVEEFY